MKWSTVRAYRTGVSVAVQAFALLALLCAVATVSAPAWLEATLGIAADRGSGETEWTLALGCACVSAALATLGRRLQRTDRARS